MSKKVDISGKRYGRLTVIELSEKKGKRNRSFWICQCDCGNTATIAQDKLVSGDTKSCGCLKREKAEANIRQFNAENPHSRRKHGCAGSRIYWSYSHMISRCYNKSDPHYPNYGGRGITVCDMWRNNPAEFFKWSEDNGYRDDLTIDRIDVNGNYEPANCRWATLKEQANNQRRNIKVRFNGIEMTLAELAEEVSVPYGTMWWRYKHGHEMSKLIKPVRRWSHEG